jgi:hypothetical protein
LQTSPVSSPVVTTTTNITEDNGSGWDNDEEDDNWGSLENTSSQLQYVSTDENTTLC